MAVNLSATMETEGRIKHFQVTQNRTLTYQALTPFLIFYFCVYIYMHACETVCVYMCSSMCVFMQVEDRGQPQYCS